MLPDELRQRAAWRDEHARAVSALVGYLQLTASLYVATVAT
jgi:hypothetical protein